MTNIGDDEHSRRRKDTDKKNRERKVQMEAIEIAEKVSDRNKFKIEIEEKESDRNKFESQVFGVSSSVGSALDGYQSLGEGDSFKNGLELKQRLLSRFRLAIGEAVSGCFLVIKQLGNHRGRLGDNYWRDPKQRLE